jgi:hypothetical protein
MANADSADAPPSPVDDDSDEQRPFIPVEARPAVADDLAKTAWQVAEALLRIEDGRQ